jgi:hypothetical protein
LKFLEAFVPRASEMLDYEELPKLGEESLTVKIILRTGK